MPDVILVAAFIEHEVLIKFVDAVVGKVHAGLVLVAFARGGVGDGAEADEALFKQEDS